MEVYKRFERKNKVRKGYTPYILHVNEWKYTYYTQGHQLINFSTLINKGPWLKYAKTEDRSRRQLLKGHQKNTWRSHRRAISYYKCNSNMHPRAT